MVVLTDKKAPFSFRTCKVAYPGAGIDKKHHIEDGVAQKTYCVSIDADLLVHADCQHG